MAPSSIEEARAFLASRRIAVLGVSRNGHDFSRAIFRELLRRGHDVVPVNPALGEAEGVPAVARLRDLTPAADAALLMVPAASAFEAVVECVDARVRRIWFHRGAGAGCATASALALCHANDVAVVQGLCPFMALPGAAFPHRAHGFLRRAFAD
jgi:predicted CoA-binding protein